MVNDPDPRLLKAIRDLESERQLRLKAEKQASALRGMVTTLRERLRTQDQRFAPVPPNPDAA